MAEIKERKKKNGKISYTACVRIKGAEPVTKTFAKKTDAQEWASSTETKIRESINFPKRAMQKMTVGDLIDRYFEYEYPKKKPNTQRDIKKSLEWFKDEIGYLYLSSVTTSKLVECREKLSKKKKEVPMINGKVKITDEYISPSTVNHYMAYMQAVFSYAVNVLDIMQIIFAYSYSLTGMV